jgi:protein gp37
MSDLFFEDIPNEYIAAVFGVMAAAPRHTFQVLTKRAGRMRAWFEWHQEEVIARDLQYESWRVCEDAAREHVPNLPALGMSSCWPLQNVWLGVSIENRRFVHRADLLRNTPAAIRFISAEPLLGPLIGAGKKMQDYPIRSGRPHGVVQETWRPGLDLTDIDWLIVGGESGPRARPLNLEWIRALEAAAAANNTTLFVKQLGKQWARSQQSKDAKGGNPEEWPAELRVRTFPQLSEAVA